MDKHFNAVKQAFAGQNQCLTMLWVAWMDQMPVSEEICAGKSQILAKISAQNQPWKAVASYFQIVSEIAQDKC